MSKIIFKRKVVLSNRSLIVNIPTEIVEAMELKKGDVLEITYQEGAFTCRKRID